MTLIERADMFASVAHAAIGQKRKYSGVDYIVEYQLLLPITVELMT